MGFTDFFEEGADAPLMTPAELKSLTELQDQYATQDFGKWSSIGKSISDMDNAAFQERMSKLSPTLLPSLKQAGTNISSYLKGEIPQDVQDALMRSSAQKGLSGGYGASSGMGRNLTARDFGLTSMNLMDKGLSGLSNLGSLTAALNPVNVGASTLSYSPSTIMNREDQLSYYNNQIANANAQITAQNESKESGFDTLLGNTVASIVGTPFNAISSSMQLLPTIAQQYASGGISNLFSPLSNASTFGGIFSNSDFKTVPQGVDASKYSVYA